MKTEPIIEAVFVEAVTAIESVAIAEPSSPTKTAPVAKRTPSKKTDTEPETPRRSERIHKTPNKRYTE